MAAYDYLGNLENAVQYLTNMVLQPHEISYSSSRSIHTKPHQRISSYEIARYSIFDRQLWFLEH